VKFDLYGNNGEGTDSTGLFLNGAMPTTPSVDMSSSGVDLHSGHPLHAHLSYDGATLTLTLTDTVTNASFTTSWQVDIPFNVGDVVGYVGFTGGTGGYAAVQNIQSWTYSSGSGQAVAATPTFSPAAGTYTSAQTVTISDTTTSATIYYTTNGATPTASSTQYTAPITVSSSETLQAIAVATGYTQSAVGSASYTISSGTTVINLGGGFTAGAMALNGKAALNGTRLRVTDGGTSEASSAWYTSPVNIQQFTTNFSFQVSGGSNPTADGFAFVIQGGTTTALGPSGGGLGYGPLSGSTGGITNSVAVKFDLYSNNGEGPDSTGLYVNGAAPTTPSLDMTSSGVNLHTTDVFNVQMTYDGTNLTMTITDATTNATFTHTWAINIPGTVGGNTAYVGFTGGTGGYTAIQDILNWTLSSSVGGSAAATPTFSPGAGTYTTAQTVTISDTTSGATIYYTTNGTTPTTSSTKYTAPITVSSSETIQAIAVATGFTQSAVGSAAYTIAPPAATPTFSPAAGTYASAQTVTISDATPGSTIYYTTNGTTPTTSSTVYTAPFTVSTSETVRAIAVASGFTQSAVGSAAYTISTQAPAPAFVQVNNNMVTAGKTVSVAFNSATKPGNTIVVYVIWDNTGTVSLTDTGVNTFSKVGSPVIWGGAYSAQVFYASKIAGGADTVTATFQNTITNWGVIYVHEYSGISSTNPVDVTVSASGSSATLNSGSATTTSANDLIFGAGVSDYIVTAAGSGFTARDLAYGNITEDRVAATTGAYSATATHTGQQWGMQMVAFRPGP